MKPIFGLSPMAGLTDDAIRYLMYKSGADITITEMISAEAVYRSESIKNSLIQLAERSRILGIPTIVQYFGSNTKHLAYASSLLEKTEIKGININAGCPDKNIIKSKAGAYLIKNWQHLCNIVSEISSINSKPVSVKIRTGYTSKEECIKISKHLERAGASFIIIHGRTVKQGYTGKANWEIIKKTKEAVSIPVYGNGDIMDWKTAYARIKETGVDGVFIGRGALSNINIFYEIKHKRCAERTYTSVVSFLKKYNNVCSMLNINCNIKRIAMAVIRGFTNASRMRSIIANTTTDDEILQSLVKYAGKKLEIMSSD